MKIDSDDITLSTGKTVYANRGIIGLDPEGDITYGYDGDFSSDKLSKEEKMEIADYQVKLWTSYLRTLEAKR